MSACAKRPFRKPTKVADTGSDERLREEALPGKPTKVADTGSDERLREEALPETGEGRGQWLR